MSVTVTQKHFVKLTYTALDADDNAVVVPAPQAFDALGSPFGAVSFGTLFSGFSLNGATSNGGSGSTGTGSTSGTSGTTGSGAPPSWISTLSDSVIKADMTAASAGGTVSETGMAQLFSGLAAELTANNAKLSASQFSDLQTIAANLNVGETASSYVTYITDALIDGNAANAKWTGGAASTTTLGNLAVGATATQINELDGKWFLGTDLPSSTVKMTGYSTFSVSYSAVTSPVFGAGGPSMNDINQGYLGDCYLLAALAEVANQNPSIIQSMITNNGNNTYGVRFYVDGNAEYVTVNDSLPDGGTIFNSATNIWASLVEKAYAQIQASGVITGNNVNDGNSFSTIGNGGDPEYTLEEITGASTITDFDAGSSSWNEYVYNDALATQSSSAGLTTTSVLSTLVGDLGQGYDEVLSSYTNATDSNGNTTLVADHALSIYGYDSTTGDLEIRNPWGTASGQYWDTTFEVSLGTLLADGDTVSIANVPASSSSVVIGALVSAAAGLQANAAVTSFTIADTLADVSAAFGSLAFDTKLTSITLTDPGTPSLTLTAAAYTTDASVLALIISPYNLTVTVALASAAATLQANAAVTSFTISDSSADVSAVFTSLASDTKLTSITLTDTSTPTLTLTAAQYTADASVLAKISGSYNLTVTGALVSAAAGLQANTHVTSFSISDSSADVASNIATLNADTKLSSIALTNSNPLSLTYAQLTGDTTALSKLPSTYTVSVSSVTVANAGTVQSNTHVTSFTISDSSADVSAALSNLAFDTKLTSITLTDTTKPTLTLTGTQFTADASVLAKITSSYNLTVTGALASAAAGLQSNSHVTLFTISDSSADVANNIAALNTDTKLSTITLTDGNPLPLTYAQLTGDTTALGKLPSTYTVSVSGVTAANAATVQTNTHVTSFTVSDTVKDVTAKLALLDGDYKLSAMTITGTTSGDTLNLSGSSVAATINMGGDNAAVSAGLSAPSLTFMGTPDAVTLGAGAAAIDYTLASTGGIETIANFQYGLDLLDISLNGAANSMLQVANTQVNGQNAISIYSSAAPTHGVVLLNVGSTMTASNLISNHLTFSNGNALIT